MTLAFREPGLVVASLHLVPQESVAVSGIVSLPPSKFADVREAGKKSVILYHRF
ncbi:hypothetical protein LNN85_07265 [Klebsiella pneumoniae subsp. pneumoniae]|nr:hypothetical protein [Klebsiella pneumoniae subsp. pneumoniae]